MLGFFGFLRAGEFTIPSNSSFDLEQHLTPQDIAVDCHMHTTMLRVRLKQSKTNPFCHGIHTFLGHSGTDLCWLSSIFAYCAIRGNDPGPLFRFSDGLL